MFDLIGDKLKQSKDAALSKGAQIAINNYMKEYGTMLKLNIDSKNKAIEAEVMLKGEVEPLKVEVGRYELEGTQLRLYNISTSREWLNVLAQSQLEGKPFEISEDIAKMLKVIV